MDYNLIINANCEDEMQKFIDNDVKFDLILTDPPYNIDKDFGNNSDKLSFSDFLNVTKKRLGLCHSLLKDNGSILWFGIHDYISYVHILMIEVGFYYRRQNIWHYENGFSRSTKEPLTHYEPFLWFSKSDKQWVYNVDDVRKPYKSEERLKNPVYYRNSKGERLAWQPNPKGAMRGDVWSFPTLAGKNFKHEKTEHPTQKPEALIIEMIKAFCPKDENGFYCGSILDPFHGSGTLGVCCEKLNKQGHRIKWIGIELEKKWCDIARERIDRVVFEGNITRGQ
ncbi:MAG: site-specific DNA-methyltransferase [Erysipelothrix sp.]|nr:site-specific DNA-methyltransferase [Erysipelothrix sp.]